MSITIAESSFGHGHLFDQCALPFSAPNGVVSLGNFGPLASSKHVVCIHDANTFIVPESYSRKFGLIYRTLLPLIGRRARRVFTVSEFSARMLAQYGVASADKITVVPNGHEHVLRWDAERADPAIFDRLKRPYVLLLGSTARHKNISVVLACAAALDQAGIDIAVVGGGSSIFAEAQGAQGETNVHRFEALTDDDLAALYGRALCLAFPSITEGFGLPPLEAMVCGCPVISSNAASLPEVGGDAFVYVDPLKPQDWQQAILALAGDTDVRAAMIVRGRQQAKKFSWASGARKYLDALIRLQS
jgi:glycosyltransferase involved in cell wall biosynthesis